ncbi:hypothetical protein MHC_02340 [Mycoplasma haemocanis str. Illinois]|uniref:Uncharacterized protein n=1 Tax=Mycoplasma haemocanis (strain Illinois) TaxID=1111676 RepID=H6N6R2_MYCHN|nr:hypothetical protein [Mycoplasma haemocanis]AEW45334.1 hypothetical protein MHC_02340 [Mycoplasma haemocanis str. Illinois]
MSSGIAKSITASTTIAVISGIWFKTAGTLFNHPTNKAHLESQNYKSLFEVKRNKFTRWREKFLSHREELQNLIPEINANSSNNEGAYFLKRWCYNHLYSKYTHGNDNIFNQLKRFCTMDIKALLLEEEDTQTIDEINATEKDKESIFYQYKDLIIKSGILKEGDSFDNLLNWCKSILKKAYKPESRKDVNDAKEFCLTPDSKLPRE